MNVQPTEVCMIYQCYMCYLDRESFALKTFKTSFQLNDHMREQHGFVLEKRFQRFRKTDFVENLCFLEYILDGIGFRPSRQAWLDYDRHGDPNCIRRRPDWNLWILEQYIKTDHPDDVINSGFIEEPEDFNQDQIYN